MRVCEQSGGLSCLVRTTCPKARVVGTSPNFTYTLHLDMHSLNGSQSLGPQLPILVTDQRATCGHTYHHLLGCLIRLGIRYFNTELCN